MVELYWTEEAKRCLQEIHTYIAQDNKAAAKNVVKSIQKKARLLRQFPKLGAVYSEVTKREIRIIYYTHYRIAYLIVNDQRIDIIGIFHGAMELRKYLR